MAKTRKDYRFSDETLRRIAACQEKLGIQSETAVVEVMLKLAYDQLIEHVDELTEVGRNDPTEDRHKMKCGWCGHVQAVRNWDDECRNCGECEFVED